MLTVDDCNSILRKYSHAGFWYTIDLTKLSQENDVYFDFIKTHYESSMYYIKLNTPFFHGLHYFTANGSGHSAMLFESGRTDYDYKFTMSWGVVPDTLHLFFTVDDVGELSDSFQASQILFIPKYSLQVPVVNGDFDDKFYINVIGNHIGSYYVDGVEVESGTDEQGTFIRLPSAEDCILGVKSDLGGSIFNLYKVTFQEFKNLPIVYIPTLYRGTPQEIKLINTNTEEEITEFQAYYNGRLLKDNIVTIPDGTGNVVDIVVALKDPIYPYCTVKLKTNVTTYTCHNQSEVETAISEGIKYIRLSSSMDIIVDGVEFNDMTLIINKGLFKNCIFNNSNILLNTTNVYDDGGNVFNNCNISSYTSMRRSLRMSSSGSVFNDCTVNYIRFYDYELYFTGTITNCRFTRSLVISDGDVTLIDNEFDGIGNKTYFPSYLYLTGEYTVTGNSFTLEGEWEELSFNMCLIKATSNFNPSQFINNNTLNLNITYDDEPTNTFYYNIVDDDKIRAVRL